MYNVEPNFPDEHKRPQLWTKAIYRECKIQTLPEKVLGSIGNDYSFPPVSHFQLVASQRAAEQTTGLLKSSRQQIGVATELVNSDVSL